MADESGKIKEVVELSEEEVARRAQTLAASNIEIAIMKNDLKEASSSARAAIKAKQAIIDELADQVRTRQETRYVDRQPGLFPNDEEEDESSGDDGGHGPADPPAPGDAKVVSPDAKWSEGANPAPLPDGAEVTDPGAVLGPQRPPKDGPRKTVKKKTKEKK